MIQRIKPAPGQESVWDYPRPPRLEPTTRHLRVVFGGVIIADTHRAYRVLETSHPPVYYIPPADIQMQYLTATLEGSSCEWKGRAAYYTIDVSGRRAEQVAWYYPDPTPAFAPIKRRRLLPGAHGRLLCGRRARHAAARRLLRRLGHPRYRGAVQGRAGQLGLVSALSPIAT